MCLSSKNNWFLRIFSSQDAAASPFPKHVFAPSYSSQISYNPIIKGEKTPKRGGDCAVIDGLKVNRSLAL